MADILLLAGLDTDASISKIKSDIDTVLKTVNKTAVELTASLKIDDSEVKTQLKSLSKTASKTKVQVDTSGFNDAKASITSYYEMLSRYIKLTKSVTFDNNDISGTVGKANFSSGNGNYTQLVNEINEVTTRMRELTSAESLSKMSERERATVLSLLAEKEAKLSNAERDSRLAIEQSIAKMQSYQSIVMSSSASIAKAESALEKMKRAQYSMNESSVNAYNQLLSSIAALRKAQNEYDGTETSIKNIVAAQKQLEAVMKSSVAITKRDGTYGFSLLSSMFSRAKKELQNLSLSKIFMQAIQYSKQMLQQVRDIDTAMTELKKVTDETDATYASFLEGASSRSKELGATIADTVTATADFARLGYSIEEATNLADSAIIYKNVGDGISDISEASESIISTMKAFGIEAEDAMSIVDKFNEVGNNFAISSEGVGEALLRSASSLEAAGNSLDESIALVTAANDVVQDPEKVGTTMKTISMYLRAAKTEAEEAGESTDGMADSVSKLRQSILDLTGNKVDIQLDENNFKSTYQIMKELSEVWGELTDISQANILEMIGGKRNSNVTASLLNNFSTAEKVLETSMGSANSAIKENEKYLNSIEGKIAVLKSSFEDLSGVVFDSTAVKGVVSAITTILNGLTKIVGFANKLGGIKTILSAAGTVLAVDIAQHLPSIQRYLTKALASARDGLSGILTSLKNISKQGLNASGVIGALGTLVTVAVAAYNAYKQAQEARLNNATESASEYNEEAASVEEYKNQIISLREELNSGNLTQEEVYEKRTQLKSIQSELIDQYEQEADGIDLVNGKLSEQIDILENLSKEKYNGWVKENTKSINEAKDKMYDYEPSFGTRIKGNSVDYYTVREEYEKLYDSDALMDSDFSESDVVEVLDEFRKLRDEIKEKYDMSNVYEAQKAYNEWYDTLVKLGKAKLGSDYETILSPALESISAYINDAKDTISDYGTIMDTYAEGQLNYSEKYADAWGNVLAAQADYEEAVKNGDDVGAEQALSNMENAKKTILAAAEGNDAVTQYLNNFFDDWDTETKDLQLQVKIKAQFNNAETSEELNGALDKFKDDAGTIDISEILNAEDSSNTELADAFDKIKAAADEAGVSVEEYLNGLNKAGIITARATDGLTDMQRAVLEQIKAIQEAQNKTSSAKATYHDLTNQLYDTVMGVEEFDLATMGSVDSLLEQINAQKQSITQLEILEQEALGVADAFNAIEAAKEFDEKIDKTDELSGLIQDLFDSYESGKFGTETFKTAFEGLVPDDVYNKFTEAGDQIDAGWEYINGKLSRYYTNDDGSISINYDNVANFVEDALKTSFGNSTVFTGTLENFQVNDQIKSIEQLANAMGITTETAYALGMAISQYSTDGQNFLDSFSTNTLDKQLYQTDQELTSLLTKRTELAKAGLIGTEEWDEVNTKIKATRSEYSELVQSAKDNIFQNMEIDMQLEGLEEGSAEYDELLKKKYELEQPSEMTIQIVLEETQNSIEEVKSKLTELATYDGKTYTAKAGVDQTEVDNYVQKLAQLEEEKKRIEAYAGIDDSDAQSTLKEIDEFTIADKTFTVTMEYGNTMTKLQSIAAYLNTIERGAHGNVKINGSTVSTTTQYSGRQRGLTKYIGSANARGNWGISSNEHNSLVGELGQELVVDPRTGMYHTVGDNGAEMVDLPKGAIVFNHKQTEALLKYGRINSRGLAFAEGNAHYGLKKYKTSSSSKSRSSSSKSSSSSSKSSSSSSSSSSSKTESEFERLYKYHQHLVAMNAETDQAYLAWLNNAYKQAYKNNEIELDDYYKYEEEVYSGLQDLFKDYLNDIEHEIDMRESFDGEQKKIVSLYKEMISAIEKEIAAARAKGLKDSDDYIQDLQSKWASYKKEIAEINEDVTGNAKDAVDSLVDYMQDMLQQDVNNQKDTLNDKLDYLKEFYDKQKEMLQDQYDEEEYLKDQSEKRKSVSDIQASLDQLQYDDSAWAQKRRKELESELADAQGELDDFERQHALEAALDALENAYDAQEEQINKEMDALEKRLNDPQALYNQALQAIQNNTGGLYEQMLEYNRRNGTGDDEDVKDTYEEAYKALLEYKQLYGTDYKGVSIKNSTGYQQNTSWNSAPVSNVQSTAASGLSGNSSSSSSSKSVTVGGSAKVKTSATHFSSKSNGVKMAKFVPGGTYTVYKKSGNQVLIGRNGVYTGWVWDYDLEGYASGTRNASVGLHAIDEKGSETIFESKDGNKYKMFSGGEKVLNAKASNFLYEFATSGGELLENLFAKIFGGAKNSIGAQTYNNDINMGDIIINGNADSKTVSAIRREQRSAVDMVLQAFNKVK